MNNCSLDPIGRWLFASVGSIFAALQPTVPFILIAWVFVFADCYTAWALSRRVKIAYPDRIKSANQGKFKSSRSGRVIITLIKTSTLILLAYLMEHYVFEDLPVKLSNIACGAICFWQFWSILENESSCNDAKWAKILQKILVDKTERHFDIDLSELKKSDDTSNLNK